MVCKYQLDFTPPTLYRIAAIQVSKHIWAREDTKKLITIRINESLKAYREDSSDDEDGYPCFVGRFYSQQAEKIFPHVESKLVLLEIPKEVIDELKTIAKSMGSFLIEWLTNISGLEGWPLVECRLFLDYVHWTFTGNIDTAKTLEAMYYARILPNSVRTWIQLSDHCLEDCLLDFASKLSPSLCAEYFSEVRENIYEPKQYLMAAYWLSTLRDPNNNCFSLEKMLKFYEFCHNKQPLEENMFLYSVHTGNYYATKYFWKFLNEAQKRKVMNMIYNYEVDDIARIDIIINMDLFIFLWNQFCMLTEHNYLPLLLDEYSIGRKLINWPWQEVFTKTFKNASKLGFNHADYEIIMHYMLDDIVVEYKRKRIYNEFREIFKNLWKNCPANLRSTFDLDGFLTELTYHEDAETIDMIINDPALAITRDSFLFMIAQEWINSNPSASFENAFFTQVLRDEEEREMFTKECQELDCVGDASESDDEDVEEEEESATE